MPLAVKFGNYPNLSRDSDFFTNGRGHHKGTKFLRFAPDSVLLVLLKYGIKPEVVHYPLPCQPYDKATFVCALDMVYLDKVTKKYLVIFW
jgi:hypothetical protein